jgi:rhodanese-related sulfurtransferase
MQWRYIENAITIDIHQGQAFINAIEELDKTKTIMYCRSGARSGKACELLNEIGIDNAFNLSGGMLAWRWCGQPINQRGLFFNLIKRYKHESQFRRIKLKIY